MNNKTLFTATYTRHLLDAIKEYPGIYVYTANNVPEVVTRMVTALSKGSANKEGVAIRRTCKELNIPYTIKAIKLFLTEN